MYSYGIIYLYLLIETYLDVLNLYFIISVFIDTSALIGGLLTVFIIMVLALIAVMWYKRHPLFSNTYCPKWVPTLRRSSMDPNSPNRGFANNMFQQEITMSTLEVKSLKISQHTPKFIHNFKIMYFSNF